ncbi:MAG: MoaD/ThiS family protein [Actinomycetota bacterium]|nr:MoaD/ThiS family protein [Actinomycetota bacterium]
MTRILLLGPAREAAGVRHDELPGETVAQVLAAAVARYGTGFERILNVSQVWLNREPVARDTVVGPHDEVVVLPPVSGG